MRSVLGPLAVHLALWLAGLGMLRAGRVLGNAWSWHGLAAGGLAYLAGIVGTLTLSLLVLVLGGPFTLPVFFALAALLAVPALRDAVVKVARGARGTRRRGPVHRRMRWTPATVAVALTVAAVGVLAVVGLLTLGNRPIAAAGETDAWHIWFFRARLLFFDSHLPTAILGFSGDVRPEPHYNINPAYPLLLPLLEAAHIRALGRPDPSSIHIVLWLLGLAFVWAGGFLAARVTRPVIWAPVLAGALVLSRHALLSGYADVPVAYYFGLGTLALGLWLRTGARTDLVVAAILFAGAVEIKNEGTAVAGVVLVVAAVIAGVEGCRARRAESASTPREGARPAPPLRDLALAAVAVIALAVLPWRLWVSAHHLQTEVPTGRYLDLHYLSGHADRVWPALRSLTTELSSPVHVTLFVAPAIALALLCLRQRRLRPLAAFYLLAGAGYVLVLVASDWIDSFPLPLLLRVSSDRLAAGPALIAVAAVLQLSGTATALSARRE